MNSNRKLGVNNAALWTVLALVAEAKVRSLVEEHAHAVVGELVAKAVLV